MIKTQADTVLLVDVSYEQAHEQTRLDVARCMSGCGYVGTLKRARGGRKSEKCG